jgi:endonuclease/exonuclease/phosphatase (EEP) superfamily protein YafD
MANGNKLFGIHFITSQHAYVLVMVTSIAVAASTLASLFGRHSYLELATHFRLQYALVASVCVVLLIVFHSWKLLPIVLCCAVINWFYIAPYYSATPGASASPAAVHLRLMLANVLGSNRNYSVLIATVDQERPDVAVLQEFTDEWRRHTQTLDSRYPYSKVVPKPGGSGMALFSRYPIENVEVLALDSSTHLALLAKVNVAGTPISILSLHPPTPVRADKFSNRNEQFARAASLMRATAGAKVLIGDLNTTMWSPYFMDLVRDSGLRDARIGFGLGPSWPLPLPAILQIPIDQCLVSETMAVERLRTGGRTGSDHRPLIVDVSFAVPPMRASR